MTDQGFGVVRPLPGNGLVAYMGGLLLVCDAAEAAGTDLIEALRETAAAGGDGRALARAAAQVLARSMTGDPATCAVAGPVGGGVAVLVSGAASATVTTADGETRLSGSDSLTWADRLINGQVERVELTLPGAGRPHPAARLDGGVVGGAGLAADLTEAGPAPTPVPSRPFTAELPNTAIHVEPDLLPPAPPAPEPPPVERAPVQMAPYPMPTPEPPVVELPPPPPTPEPPPFESSPFEPLPGPASGPQPAVPQEPSWGPPPMPGPSSGPMSAVPPLPDAPPHGNGTAPDQHFEPAEADPNRPLVYGVDCKNDHFNDPRVPYCAVCGIALVQRTLVPYKGPRPSLGVLILDDGMALPLESDYLLGRDPERAPEVAGGNARPAKVTSPDGSVSRRHLRVALDGWDVNLVDLGSVNGTQIQPPGDPNFYDIPPNEPVTITPGTTVRVGVSRTMRFEAHRG